MSKIKLKITKVEQYESADWLLVFLHSLGLKTALKTRRHLERREGEYWERCEQCDIPMGEHDEPCSDGYDPRMEPEYYEDR